MALVLRSLSDFKRFLARPGATIEIVKNTFVDRQPLAFQTAYREKGMYQPRTVQALSKKAAIFAVRGHPTTVWLYWDKGTRKWRFSQDTVAIPLDTGLGPPDEIVYRCSYAPGMEPACRAPARDPAIRNPADGSVADKPKAQRPKPPRPPSPSEHGFGKAFPGTKPPGPKVGKVPASKRGGAEPRQGRLL